MANDQTRRLNRLRKDVRRGKQDAERLLTRALRFRELAIYISTHPACDAEKSEFRQMLGSS